MNSSPNRSRGRKSRERSKNDARYAAMVVLEAVIAKGRSLATARSLIVDSLDQPRERSLAMELVNGVLRWRFRLEAVLAELLDKPLRKKDIDVQLILMLALYQLTELGTPDYAVVNEAVAQTRRIHKKWASAMVNAVLRGFIRDRQALMATLDRDGLARFSHPVWLVDLLKQDWPHDVEQILEANNQRPPMWLRVNLGKVSIDDYASQLESQGLDVMQHPHAIAALKLVHPRDVRQLPGFGAGLVSVQDASAQLAAQLLAAENDERVLDLCAAPGGKTCHILETAANVDMTAVELEPLRMEKVQQNLDRLGLRASLIVADAGNTQGWWNGRLFDRILVDAPCSASGVIRRHPDIKSLRQADDLVSLTRVQQQILQQAWMMLRPGGVLLYATCSVFKQENENQIEVLLSAQNDAEEIVINENWGIACDYGRQLLPGDMDGDGFYYAKLKKRGKATQAAAIDS